MIRLQLCGDKVLEITKEQSRKFKTLVKLVQDIGSEESIPLPTITLPLMQRLLNVGENVPYTELPLCIWAAEFLHNDDAMEVFANQVVFFLNRAKPEEIKRFLEECNKLPI
jgi:hypothetical protein